MQKLAFGVLFPAILALASVAFSETQGTAMLTLRPADSPAIFIRTNHTNKDFLKSAILKNVSNLVVTGYRIGWVAVYPTGKEKVGLGTAVDLPAGLSSGSTIVVPAQEVSIDYAKEGAIAVVFFVTAIHTSKGTGTEAGSVWKLATEEFETEALALTKSAL